MIKTAQLDASAKPSGKVLCAILIGQMMICARLTPAQTTVPVLLTSPMVSLVPTEKVIFSTKTNC